MMFFLKAHQDFIMVSGIIIMIISVFIVAECNLSLKIKDRRISNYKNN